MTVEVKPYFAEGERYPALIGVRAEGDEYETAYVSKSELVDALAENARLRELLSSYWKAVHSSVTPNVPRDYLKEMRELGIEVPS